jgi:hypothetical protein
VKPALAHPPPPPQPLLPPSPRWGIHYVWEQHGAVVEGAAGLAVAAGARPRPQCTVGSSSMEWVRSFRLTSPHLRPHCAVRQLGAWVRGRTVCAVLCGGNIAPGTHAAVLAAVAGVHS